MYISAAPGGYVMKAYVIVYDEDLQNSRIFITLPMLVNVIR